MATPPREPAPREPAPRDLLPRDLLHRPLGVLRLSLTARCNLACTYCCPDSADPPGLLNLAERRQLVECAVGLGVHTLRLTGGEPLLYPQLDALLEALAPLRQRAPSDPRGALGCLALTSNGALLSAARARALRAAGLDRITLSLDAVAPASVARMAGLQGGAAAGEALLAKVLAALEHARAAGFDPERGQLKLNAVIQAGPGGNADQLLPLAALARERGVELRLIEFMDVGNRNGWNAAAVWPAAAMVGCVDAQWPLEPVGRDPHGTAIRWRYRDGGGYLAVVASISAPFCGDCNRLRITADGVAYRCLFAATGSDLKPWLRPSLDAIGLTAAMAQLWQTRQDRYSEERSSQPATGPAAPHAEMAYLGG